MAYIQEIVLPLIKNPIANTYNGMIGGSSFIFRDPSFMNHPCIITADHCIHPHPYSPLSELEINAINNTTIAFRHYNLQGKSSFKYYTRNNLDNLNILWSSKNTETDIAIIPAYIPKYPNLRKGHTVMFEYKLSKDLIVNQHVTIYGYPNGINFSLENDGSLHPLNIEAEIREIDTNEIKLELDEREGDLTSIQGASGGPVIYYDKVQNKRYLIGMAVMQPHKYTAIIKSMDSIIARLKGLLADSMFNKSVELAKQNTDNLCY